MKKTIQMYRRILILLLSVSVALLGITCVIPAMQNKEEAALEKYVYPSGEPVGIYMHAKGVLVVECGAFLTNEGKKESPVKYKLKKGDYILAVNNKEIRQKAELIQCIEQSEGKNLDLLILRDGEKMLVHVTAIQNVEDIYKLGIWICDSTQGIGTMTFVTEDGKFAALGHGIGDNTTDNLLQMDYGAVYKTSITSIKKGKKDIPGELTGLISLKQSEEMGDLNKNCSFGIFGSLEKNNYVNQRAIKTATYKEIQIGEAEILCKLDGELQRYKVRITNCRRDYTKEHKDIAIEITDSRLINKTGGIIQGMSGAPIIQNDRLIGAVTHVCVDDPTRGYAIFIEEMLGDN